MCLTTCHHQGAFTCMVDMCPLHGTSRGHGHAWVPCVRTHVTSRDYGYAWVPCVLTNGTSMKSGQACPSPCDDHQWKSHNSFISCLFWTFLGSLESLSRAQPGSDNCWPLMLEKLSNYLSKIMIAAECVESKHSTLWKHQEWMISSSILGDPII